MTRKRTAVVVTEPPVYVPMGTVGHQFEPSTARCHAALVVGGLPGRVELAVWYSDVFQKGAWRGATCDVAPPRFGAPTFHLVGDCPKGAAEAEAEQQAAQDADDRRRAARLLAEAVDAIRAEGERP